MKHKFPILFLVSMLFICTMHAAPESDIPQPGKSVEGKSTNITVNVTTNGTAKAQTSSKSSSESCNKSEQSVLDSIITWLLTGWTLNIGNGQSRLIIRT